MRWKPKPSKNIFEWHSWFAWHVVAIFSKEGGETRVWWETIERKARLVGDGDIGYEYRLPIENEFHDVDDW